MATTAPVPAAGGVIYMTYQHFAYGVDRHCHTKLAFNLRQRQLAQGDHLKKRCKLLAPTWRAEVAGLLKPARRLCHGLFDLRLDFSQREVGYVFT